MRAPGGWGGVEWSARQDVAVTVHRQPQHPSGMAKGQPRQ